MQPRYVCTHKLGYCSLSCGWMEIRLNIASYITVCICWPQVRLLECLPRELALHFTACLLTDCCSDVNTTAKCWCILAKGTYIIWMFGWKCWISFCSVLFSSGLAALDIHIVYHIPYTWLSKYDRKFCYKTTRMCPSDNFLFTADSIFLSRNILDAYNKKGSAHYSWSKIVVPGTLVTLQHTCNHPCIYVTESKGMTTRI
jgi:hypothetical protein